MLQSIHDKAKGILGIIIVIFLGLVFALWGVGDYLTGATEKYAARVDDAEISQSEFEQGMARQRQRLEQMFQGEVPDSPIFQQRIKEQVLEQLITRKVLQKMVADEGYQISDVVLAEKIKSMEAFQQDGAFAVDAYQQTIESQGMAVKEFENLFRSDLEVQQLQDAVMASTIVGKGELNILNQIQQQSRDVNYLLFNNIQYFSSSEVSEDEIADYFDNNQARYMHPETVSISYVELKGSELANDVPVDDEAIQRLYDEYVSGLVSKQQRKASHILISLSADADEATQQKKKSQVDDLLARLKKGESFEALAKENSEDPGSASKGGDLGWVSKGMMVPEFENALFSLQKSQISDAVKSSFGYHIIKLDDLKSAEVASFDAKKAELVEEYKAQTIEDRFYEKSELMATTAYENDQSLQEVADVLGVQIKTTPAFSRNKGSGLSANEKVRKAAFDSAVLSEGRNSDIIELDKNHALVLRVDIHTKAKAKQLADVKPQIIAALKSEKAKQKSQAAALTALAQLEKGEPIESKTVNAAAKLNKLGLVKRDNQTADPLVIREAFTMSKPLNDKPVYKVVELAAGSAVIELNAVSLPAAASKEELQALVGQVQNEQANRDMAAVLEYLKSRVDIVRSKEL